MMEALVQGILRQLLRRSGPTWPGLDSLTPVEIEQLVARSDCYVHIDMDGMIRAVRKMRVQTLAEDLVQAGAANQVLRDLFGLSPRQLSALRRKTGVRTYGYRRLSPKEQLVVLRWLHNAGSARHDPLATALSCLKAAHRLQLPFMAIFRFYTHLTEEAIDEPAI